jgi:hypothetical protein
VTTWHYLAVRRRFDDDIVIGFVEAYRDESGAIRGWTENMLIPPRGTTEAELRYNLHQMLHDLARWGVVEESELKPGFTPELRSFQTLPRVEEDFMEDREQPPAQERPEFDLFNDSSRDPAGFRDFVNRLTRHFQRNARAAVARLRRRGITVVGPIAPDVFSEMPAKPFDESATRERVMLRLQDWQARVHALYDEIEHALPAYYILDRQGKHYSQEELVQRFRIDPPEVPPIDILRIERPAGTLRAFIQPRALWTVGANGALQLLVTQPKASLYAIFDLSPPLSGPARWIYTSYGASADRRPFSGSVLAQLLRE